MTDPKLVETIAELYSCYSGYEIADAHKIVRAQLDKQQALERAQWELAQAQKTLNNITLGDSSVNTAEESTPLFNTLKGGAQ
jgi:hypothetical protein